MTLDHPRSHPAGATGVIDAALRTHRSRPPTPSVDRLRTWLIAAAAYLVLSVIVWWNVWSGHPTLGHHLWMR